MFLNIYSDLYWLTRLDNIQKEQVKEELKNQIKSNK